jgi:hypothetical protein
MSLELVGWVPRTPDEKKAVRDQLGRLLAHPIFRGSKRCATLLRYTVEYRLQNESGLLKERVLGAEVFGRDADYDTNEDSIVRHTASDIRKKIAQYYFEQGHQDEIRIDLPSGSYLPEFFLQAQAQDGAANPITGAPPLADTSSTNEVHSGSGITLPRFLWVLSSIVLIVLVGAIYWFGWRHNFHDVSRSAASSRLNAGRDTDLFWGPILDDPSPVLICLEKPKAQVINGPIKTEYVALSDAVFAMRLTSILSQKNKPFEIKLDSTVTPQDLTRGTIIFIGESEDSRMGSAMESLRFRLVRAPGSGVIRIEDRKNPVQRDWFVRTLEKDWPTPSSMAVPEPGYAIVARFKDSSTKHWVVIAAAPGGNSMRAAQDFLLDPKLFNNELTAKNQIDWTTSNIEAVVKTQLVDGDPGPPQILALEVW